MNLLLVIKALSNEHRLKILEWLKEPAKYFTSSHCDVSTDGVCVGLIETKNWIIPIHRLAISFAAASGGVNPYGASRTMDLL